MKRIVSVFILLTSLISFAQQEKIEVTYMSKIILPKDFSFQSSGDSGRQMPKERQEEFIKSIQEPQEFTLTILGDESVYKMIEKISNNQNQGMRNPRGGSRMGMMYGDNVYKNISTHHFLKEQNMMGKNYTIKDSLPKFD
ncbi:hypothetical protein [Empedobacter brevis]|uniref:hypothetical protein n=1 Tax=Empedobacter brevis TaxID=247 RepID=UPI0023F1ABE4|nr:hypothetical protein [Empedobacter brevis]